MMKVLLIISTAVLLMLNFIKRDINKTAYYTPSYDGKEKYDLVLNSLNTVDKLAQYIDKLAKTASVEYGTVEYVTLVEDVIGKRFYHGFSHLALSENWIAAMGEKIGIHGLSCKVEPEQIMQHGTAACSQQCMVMMEILKKKGIAYRKIGFPHHYALEASIGGVWHYFDPNMEPDMTIAQRREQGWAHAADNLKQYYDPNRFKDLDYKFGKGEQVIIGPVNETPARNAKAFHAATGLLAKTAWLLPLTLLAFSFRRQKAAQKTAHFQHRGILYNIESWLLNRAGLRTAGRLL